MSKLLRRQPQAEAQIFAAETRPHFVLAILIVAPAATALASTITSLLVAH